MIAFDVETCGLNPRTDKLYSLGICWENGEAEAWPVWDIPERALIALADPSIEKVAHRARFDLKFLAAAGIVVRGPVYCTKIMAHLIDENADTGLKALAEKYFGAQSIEGKTDLDAAMKKAGVSNLAVFNKLDLLDPEHANAEVILKYNAEDCINTFNLAHKLKEKLISIAASQKRMGYATTVVDYFKNESMPAELMLLDVEQRGIAINMPIITQIKERVSAEREQALQAMDNIAAPQIDTIENEMYEVAVAQKKSDKGKAAVERSSDKYKTKFNWNSGQHLGRVLSMLAPNHDFRTTARGTIDTSELALSLLRLSKPSLAPLLEQLALYKKKGKLLSTYLDGLVEHVQQGRIYAEYDPFIVTGRFSSMRPNLQNLPRGSDIKKFFVPSPGNVFIYADYSQIELRVAAHASQDATMIEVFKDNLDPHTMLAERIFGCKIDKKDDRRNVGKVLNFMLIYKGSANRVYQELNEKLKLNYSLEDCKDFIRIYFEMYAGYAAYLQKQESFMRTYKCVIADNGRVRRLPDIIYGEFLDWRKRTFTGSNELVQRLTKGEHLGREALFDLAAGKFSHAKKQGFNMPIQSLAATIAKRALIQLAQQGYKIVTTVHDSIVVEVPINQASEINKIKHIMEHTYPISVPTLVDIKLLNSLLESDIFVLSNRAESA